jgi:hypothetical protein
MKIVAVLFCFLFIVGCATAQTTSDNSFKNITVQKDTRLDALVKKSRDINEEVYYKTIKNLPGYRVQVINTNDRTKALDIKTRLLSDFPDEKTYLLYHSPYFKIQMGNFRTREDAEKLMKRIKAFYPSGVFIVPSRIEIRPSKDGEIIL